MDMFCKRIISDEEPQSMSTVVEAVVHNVSKSVELFPDRPDEVNTDDAMHTLQPSPLDIGHALDRLQAGDVLTDVDRDAFLTKRWRPTKREEYPWSEKKRPKKKEDMSSTKRYLGQNHLDTFPWLAVSIIPGWKGAWCVYCVLFKTSSSGGGRGSEGGRGGGQAMGKLVLQPLTNFADLTGKSGSLSTHQESQFHKTCALRFVEFSARALQTTGQDDVRSKQDKERRRIIEANRAALVPICNAILTCARQNLGLRGHRDDGPIETDGTEPMENDGNFRALLRFRMRGGDTAVKSAKR